MSTYRSSQRSFRFEGPPSKLTDAQRKRKTVAPNPDDLMDEDKASNQVVLDAEDAALVDAQQMVTEFNNAIVQEADDQTIAIRHLPFDNYDLLQDVKGTICTYVPQQAATDDDKNGNDNSKLGSNSRPTKDAAQAMIKVADTKEPDDQSNDGDDMYGSFDSGMSDQDKGAQDENRMRASGLTGKLNNLYETAADGEVSYDPNKFHWEILKEWRDANVKYQCKDDILGYRFKEEDEEGYFAEQVNLCQKFFKKNIDDDPNRGDPGVDMNLLAHYEVNQQTGEKFLRLTLRQWKTSYDPEVTNQHQVLKNRLEKKMVKEYEIHSVKFLKFDEELQEFEEEDEILYDISEKFLDPFSGAFNNDFFLTKNEHTYYFKKDRERQGFQLYRHSYGTKFQKFPIDNDNFPFHSNEMLEGYFIKAPEGKKLRNLQISFLKNASPEYSLRNDQLSEELCFLENQYVMIKEKIYRSESQQEQSEPPTDVWIHKVTSKDDTPIWDSKRFKPETNLVNLQCGFFVKIMDDGDPDECQLHICLKCKKRDYQIQVQKDDNDLPQMREESAQPFERCNQHMIFIQNLEIELERQGDRYNQSFFLSKNNCRVNFIHPLHSSKQENISSDIKNKQQEVSTHIQRNFLNNQIGKIAYQDDEFAYMSSNDFKGKILSDINPKTGFDNDDEFISTADMILKVNIHESKIHIWSMNPQFEKTSFRDTITEIRGNDQKLLQEIILQQYSQDNQKIHQDNYDIHDTLGILQNQYLNRVYLTTREGIYLEHHKAFIVQQTNPVEVPDNSVLMDLGDKEGQISLVRLFNSQVLFNQEKRNKSDIKLTSYHISYTANVVAFFFIQRNKDRQSGTYASQINQSGVNFMVVHQISKLQQMAAKVGNSASSFMSPSCVIERNTPIFIFGKNLRKLVYTTYDRNHIMKYQDNSKAASMMASTIVHEMVHDPNNPMDHIVPFLFSSEQARLPAPIFRNYLCFMKLNNVKAFMEANIMDKNKQQHMDLSSFCDVFNLKNVDDPVLKMEFGKKRNVRYENDRTRDCPLFCRSAPWSKSQQTDCNMISGRDIEDSIIACKNLDPHKHDEKPYICSTKFQIGFVICPKDTQFFEITEYLVTFHSHSHVLNLDLIDAFGKKRAEAISMTKIEPYRMQHIMPSVSTNETFIGQQKYWENHRLVPIIDNQGIITGTHLMLNLYMIYKENTLIDHDEQKIVAEKKNLGDNYEIIRQNAGNEVLLLRTTSQTTGLIYLNSGRQYEVPLSILLYQQENQQLSNKLDPKPHFIYQMICTSDWINEPHIQYQTPLMQVGYKQYALDDQPGNLITICTSRFNENVVNDQVFDRLNMQFLLHKSQMDIITASIPSFKEIFKCQFEERVLCYFQFRFIINGRSFCSIDYPSFKTSIQSLVYAINDVELDYAKLTEDSAIYKMFSYDSDSDEVTSKNTIKEIFSMLNIQPQMNFMSNWNYESFIQKSLDHHLNRPLLFIMEHLLEEIDEPRFKGILVQDLPQLLIQDQVSIEKFLNEYKPSQQEEELSNSNQKEQKKDGCRLETSLTNPDLPIIGDDGLESISVENFVCFYNMRQEILNHIIKESQMQERVRYRQNQELMKNGEDIPLESRVEIEHTFINFIPLINKIKIDLLMQRPSNSLSYTQYLGLIKCKPQEFDNINDMFLTDLMSFKQDDQYFFQQETIQKIIDRQFNYTAKFIERLLSIYAIGFVVPFVILLCVEKDTRHHNSVFVLIICCEVVCGITQFFLLTLEAAEISYSGIKVYMKDAWNYFDATQYFIFLIQMFLENQYWTKHNGPHFWIQIVKIILLIQTAVKFLHLIRYNESFCFLVEMLIQVSKDIYPFLIVFFTFCAVFMLITQVIEGGYKADDYDYMGPFPTVINILQTFRNSIGDIKEPAYGNWIPDADNTNVILKDNYQYGIMIVTWFFFVANIFIMQIVLLNFLIAEVSMTYERINSLGSCLLYQKKQELNFFVQKVLKFYQKEDLFKALTFVAPTHVKGDEDQFIDVKNYVKLEMECQMNKLKKEVIPNQKKILESCSANMAAINETDQKVAKMKDEIDGKINNMQAILEKMYITICGGDDSSFIEQQPNSNGSLSEAQMNAASQRQLQANQVFVASDGPGPGNRGMNDFSYREMDQRPSNR